MVLLVASFAAGVFTALAPCVLPLLPVIVGGSVAAGSRHRTYVIIGSLATSILFFTLLLKATTILIAIPEEVWRYVSGSIITLIGLSMLFPSAWSRIPIVGSLNRGSNKLLGAGYSRQSLGGDIVMGAALGPVFASCSPTYFLILATVLPAKPILGLMYLVLYTIGLSLMLYLIAILGDAFVKNLGITIEPQGLFRRGLGVLLVVVGILVFSGTMRHIETWLIDRGFNASLTEYRFLPTEMNSVSLSAGEFLSPEEKARVYQKAPEFVEPDGYINTGDAPISLEEFRGKNPVLIDIWTYSCINCQRTLPYLRKWDETYRKDGLVIIGVHTPEFAFEKVQKNVERAAADFGLKYPILLDNEYKTWNAFGNQYWPRKYLIDIDGYIVYDHAGEGAYEETENAILRVLAERASRTGKAMPEQSMRSPQGTINVDFQKVKSREVYFGSARNEYLGNGTPFTRGRGDFIVPEKLFGNTLYLGGAWQVEAEFAENLSPGRIVFSYGAKNVYMVAAAKKEVRLLIRIDGKVMPAVAGADVDENGIARVHEEKLYELVHGLEYGTHVLEIEIENAGLEAYTFTFG